MRAAVITRYGPPDVVQIRDVAKPTIKANELLVRVYATTVNRTDCGYRAAQPFILRLFTGLTRPRTTVLGTEFAGVVEAVGPEVTAYAVGDRVFGYVEGSFGAHAEYLAIRDSALVTTMPDGVTFEQAAASTEGAHYALSFIRWAKIRSGHDVLINGATGAIGSAAVQLVKHLGANVTAVCATEQLALVRQLGADRVIDYTTEDFTKDGQTYDVVLDAVGKSSFRRCRQLLKPRGVYVSSDLGPLSQNPVLAIVTPLFRGRRVAFPLPREDREMLMTLRELLKSGAFEPVIDKQYSLEQLVEAYTYVESGQKIGNVVINVGSSSGADR
jgi:NADPH:quinone reductase-like Zn-dependent oxidoreductase